MSESEYVDRTPLDDPAWVIALVEERDALRARVRELEGAVEAARTTAIREAVERLSDDVIARELSPPVDEYGGFGWWFNDAASFRTALLETLLPAPAPGRDTNKGGVAQTRPRGPGRRGQRPEPGPRPRGGR